ncbi:MAG: hypothetical protein Q8M20_17890 [Rhodocyclaceae bacterium]|nr:hypothetical protein [Rhodocyclaceae bacterium]MDZ4213733.1 hypothetical protein [Rhodocyclaceae bacterium]
MITFDEAVHIIKGQLSYDAKLAAKVLGSAMHSGSVGYSSQPIQTSDDSTTIITGQPPSPSSLVSHDDVLDLIESRRNPKRESAVPPTPTLWPWGDYDTKLLRELAASAERFWKNYDPADPGTAPTNDQVIAWLIERGVAKRNAQLIATMLRADGLPTGPRK